MNTRKEKKNWVFIFVVLVMVFNLFACMPTPAAPPREPLEILIGGGYWPGFFPVVLAQEKGFFAAEGVEVNYSYATNFDQKSLDWKNEKYDATAYPFAAFVELMTEFSDIRVVLVTDQSTTADAVVARPEIKTIADLKNQRIMAAPGAYGEMFVSAMLSQAGLKDSDVSWTQLSDEKSALAALKAGDVAALQIWEPYISQAQADGAHVLFSGADAPGLTIDAIAFHAQTLQGRPDDVRAFLRAWFRAVDELQAHPDESAVLIASALKVEPASISMEGLQLYTLNDNLKTFAPGDTYASLYFTAQAYADLLIKKGVVSHPLDINKMLDPSLLKPLK